MYEKVYPDLLRFVQRRAHPDHAEDVVADAFLVVWRRLDELPRFHDDARAWVFGITRNLLLNQQRGEQRRRALGVRLADAKNLPYVLTRTPTWS
ncbi:MAG TPA: sigma factor [Nonomuraea sp.]|nr:sigma factor [Nonomuraea sp.]